MDSTVLNWDLPDESKISPDDYFDNLLQFYQMITKRAREGTILPDPLPPLISESGTIIYRDFEIE